MKLRNLILAFGLVLMALTAGAIAAQNTGGSGFLGVRLQDSEDGVVIREVVEGSPAAVGLQEGDVITEVNGQEVSTAAEVAALVQAATPGDTITLTLTRDGESQEVEVELGSTPPDMLQPRNGGGRPGDVQPPFEMMQVGIVYNPAEEVWEIRMLAEGTPLYEAGLRQDDVVTAFNGEAHDMATLRALVESSGADGTITLTVERDGAEQQIDVPASAVSEFYAPMSLDGFQPVDPRFAMPGMLMVSNGRLGVAFVTLTEESAAENDVEFVEGALIQDVEADSPAAQAGVQAGDIVTAVNGEPVDQERTLRDRIFAYEPGDVVTLTVTRDGESMDIDVTLGEQTGDMFMISPGMMPEIRMFPPEMERTPEPGLSPDVTPAPGV